MWRSLRAVWRGAAPAIGIAAAIFSDGAVFQNGGGVVEPQRVVLLETPEAVSDDAVAAGISSLSFACNDCGALVIPPGAVNRITVRRTPWHSPLGKKPAVSSLATGVFCSSADNVSAATTSRVFAIGSDPSKFPQQPYQRDVHCARCGRYLGYRLEDEDGHLMTVPGRPPYKLWYQCGDAVEPSATSDSGAVGVPSVLHTAKCHGASLRLVDESAWHALEPHLPRPLTGKSTQPPNSLERSARLVQSAASADVVAAETRRALAAAVAAAEAGVFYMRALAPQDRDPHQHGLRPRHPDARISPADHVLGKRKSQYLSMSSDLGVVLMWALPYGEAVIVVPRFALRLGSTILPPSAVGESIELAADNDLDRLRAQEFADRSQEALVLNDIDPAAVEEVRSEVVRVHAGAVTACDDTQAEGEFPRTANAFRALAPVPIPACPGAEPIIHGGEVVSPADYFARRGVIALAPDGSAEPSFLMVRMTPNATQRAVAGNRRRPPLEQLEHLDLTLDAGRGQLLNAQQRVSTTPGAAAISYYELDVQLWQQRIVLPTLHHRVVQRVPVLLVPWGPRGVNTATKLCAIKREGAP